MKNYTKYTHEEFIKHCEKSYPNLYKKSIYFEHNSGWFNLIDRLSNDIEKELNKKNYVEDDAIIDEEIEFVPIYADQVKEKFGGLRFYLSGYTNPISNLITEAEKKSLKICEDCGNKGSIRKNGGWYKAECDECYSNKIFK